MYKEKFKLSNIENLKGFLKFLFNFITLPKPYQEALKTFNIKDAMENINLDELEAIESKIMALPISNGINVYDKATFEQHLGITVSPKVMVLLSKFLTAYKNPHCVPLDALFNTDGKTAAEEFTKQVDIAVNRHQQKLQEKEKINAKACFEFLDSINQALSQNNKDKAIYELLALNNYIKREDLGTKATSLIQKAIKAIPDFNPQVLGALEQGIDANNNNKSAYEKSVCNMIELIRKNAPDTNTASVGWTKAVNPGAVVNVEESLCRYLTTQMPIFDLSSNVQLIAPGTADNNQFKVDLYKYLMENMEIILDIQKNLLSQRNDINNNNNNNNEDLDAVLAKESLLMLRSLLKETDWPNLDKLKNKEVSEFAGKKYPKAKADILEIIQAANEKFADTGNPEVWKIALATVSAIGKNDLVEKPKESKLPFFGKKTNDNPKTSEDYKKEFYTQISKLSSPSP